MTEQQSNYIKIIAVLSMLVDHVGLVLFPQYPILRMIGRISFPLFAYQIGIGVSHTKDLKKYFLRLFIFGTIMQIGYSLVATSIGEDPFALNIFLSLALGILSIYTYNKKLYILTLSTLTIPFFLSLIGITVDYSSYGILLILGMYLTRKTFLNLAIYTTLLTFIFSILWDYPIQMYAIIALLFIAKPFSIKINIPQFFFYLFYPAHLVLIYLISELGFF